MFYANLIVVGLVLLLLQAPGGVEAECFPTYGDQRCLTKSEMPGEFELYFESGDPCFIHEKKQFCFVGTNGALRTCQCSSDCGCRKPPSPLKCDIQTPTSDCQTNQTTLCTIYGSDHTMCSYCGVNMTRCHQVCARGLTPEEKKEIVDYHNELRSIVANGRESRGLPGPQPGATDMFELKWDEELATIAQTWTDQCLYEHDKNRQTKNKQYAGQNIGVRWDVRPVNDKRLKAKIKGWYDEVELWPSYNVAQFTTDGSGGEVKHYTQFVWAKTKFVGCGFITSYDSSVPKGPYRQMLICNYSPGGNLFRQPLYKTGPPGSKCPRGRSLIGLCKH